MNQLMRTDGEQFLVSTSTHPPGDIELAGGQEGFEQSDGESTSIAFIALTALRRWGWLSIPLGLIASTAAAAIVWCTHSSEYKATAFFQVDTDNTFDGLLSPDKQQAYDNFVQTQVELVRSPLVLGQVVASIAALPEVREQKSPLNWLSKKIKVVPVGQSDLMQIEFVSTDPETARQIVKAISDKYIQLYSSDSKLRHHNMQTMVETEISKRAVTIEGLRARYGTLFQQQTGRDPFAVAAGPEPATGVEEPASSSSMLEPLVIQAGVRLEMAEAALKAFIAQIPGKIEVTDEDLTRALADDKSLETLKDSIRQKHRDLQRLTVTPAKKIDEPVGDPRGANAAEGDERARLISQLKAEIEVLKRQLEHTTIERERRVREALEVQAWRKVLEKYPAVPSPEEIRAHVDRHPDLAEHLARAEAHKEQVESYASLLPDGTETPEMVRLKETHAELQKTAADFRQQLIDELTAAVSAAARRERLEHFDKLVADAEDARNQHDVLRRRHEMKLAQHQTIVRRAGQETIELEFARHSYELEKELYQELNKRLLELKTEAAGLDRVQLRQEASVDPNPVNPPPFRNMIMAAIVALGIPTGLATLWEWHVKRISDADQFSKELGIPILGEVARLPGKRRVYFGSVASGADHATMVYEQSTLVLSDNVSHSTRMKNVRVVAVTSAMKGEGKSHVAAKLAVNLARVLPGKVLLIDGDIRFRTIERLLRTTTGPGLSEALRGDCSVFEAIQEIPDIGLHVIPAGNPADRACDLIRNGVLPRTVQELRDKYQFIIIDTPPVLSAGESLSLSKVADGALICALRDVSRIAKTRKALMRLYTAGVRPLGAILVGVPTSTCEASYYVPPTAQSTVLDSDIIDEKECDADHDGDESGIEFGRVHSPGQNPDLLPQGRPDRKRGEPAIQAGDGPACSSDRS